MQGVIEREKSLEDTERLTFKGSQSKVIPTKFNDKLVFQESNGEHVHESCSRTGRRGLRSHKNGPISSRATISPYAEIHQVSRIPLPTHGSTGAQVNTEFQSLLL
jgi:hypothetical protein